MIDFGVFSSIAGVGVNSWSINDYSAKSIAFETRLSLEDHCLFSISFYGIYVYVFFLYSSPVVSLFFLYNYYYYHYHFLISIILTNKKEKHNNSNKNNNRNVNQPSQELAIGIFEPMKRF